MWPPSLMEEGVDMTSVPCFSPHSFKSRKCGDAFAEALSRSLPTMGNLKKLG